MMTDPHNTASGIPSTEFQNRAGQYLEEAAKGPVTITRYGRPLRVLLDAEEYARLLKQAGENQPVRPPSAPEVLRRLRHHKDELRQLGIDQLMIFGSVARGEEKTGSDIDLLAHFDPKAKIGPKIVSITECLEEIVGASVHLLSAPVKKAELRRAIEAEAINVF